MRGLGGACYCTFMVDDQITFEVVYNREGET